MKTDLFQSCDHYWVFQIFWHIEINTLSASSFKIWKNSTGIPPLPLALFIVMLPKAHLTLHSRSSGSRWVITWSWLSFLNEPYLPTPLLPYNSHFSSLLYFSLYITCHQKLSDIIAECLLLAIIKLIVTLMRHQQLRDEVNYFILRQFHGLLFCYQ